MLSNIGKRGFFLGSQEIIEEAKVVIVGVPLDYTSSFRPGSRFGPESIRQASIVLETYSPALERSLEEIKYYDAGDILLPFGNVEKGLKRISLVTREILDSQRLPVILGGEHLVTLPVVQEIYRNYPDLYVLHFDAHADLRVNYEGESFSHATVIRNIADLIGGNRIFQFGIRSGTREEFNYARDNTNLLSGNINKQISSCLEAIGSKPVYLTIDIDVLDPAFAPGTGTPEPGGCSTNELLEAVYSLKDLKIVGFDIVEVNPAYDSTERTQVIAAKLLRELLLLLQI